MRGVVKKNAAVFAENLVFVSSAPRELLKKSLYLQLKGSGSLSWSPEAPAPAVCTPTCRHTYIN